MNNQIEVTFPSGSTVSGQTERYQDLAVALANLLTSGPDPVEVIFAFDSDTPSPAYLFKTWVTPTPQR
jgi:hypothetical protein